MSRNPSQCTLQINSNALHQVEKFMYLRVVFMSDRRQNNKINSQIGKA